MWWQQVYLSYTALVKQITIAQPACRVCYCQEGLGACSPGKFLKLHALTWIESEGISNIFCIGVFLTLAVHIVISYSYLFIYNYFNQSCYCVTFTDLNDPLGSDPVTRPENNPKLTHTASDVSTSYSIAVCMWLTGQLANSNYKLKVVMCSSTCKCLWLN